jgi:hypothetical protein
MGRGRGGRYSFGRSDSLDISLDFNLFSSDENGNAIRSTVANGITSYTFANAVENFQGRFRDNSDAFKFDVINITDRFARSGDPITLESSLTTDLTARYLSNQNTLEFAFQSPELTEIGINEVTLVIPDQDKDLNGFQINGNTIQDPRTAIDDLESISNTLREAFSASNLEAGVETPLVGITAISKDNSGLISSDRSFISPPLFPVIIEAEDIIGDFNDPNDPNDDTDDPDNTINITDYQRDNFTGLDPDGAGLRLVQADPNIKGIISFRADDYDISGAYNLRVNAFDENDGAATINVQVTDINGNRELGGDEDGDGILDGVTIQLNENTNSPSPDDNTSRSYFIGGLNLDPTDTITITGTFNNDPSDDSDPLRRGEFARIDYLAFNPVDI